MIPDSQDSLTFFKPLKDENSFAQSGFLQSFLGFFNAKKIAILSETNSNDNGDGLDHLGESNQQQRGLQCEEEVPNARSLALKSNASSTNLQKKSVKPRAFTSQSLSEEAFTRPSILNVPSFYDTKEHGSEVELRLKNISTLFKEIPRKITKSNHYLKDVSELRSSNFDDKNLKQYWMPDKQCRECYECNERFTTFRRRHHCRICGHIFCSRCCYQLISGEIIGYPGMVRSCTYCYKMLVSHDVDGLHDAVTSSELDGLSELQHDRGSNMHSSDVTNFRDKPYQRMGRTRSMVSVKHSPVKIEAATSTVRTSHDFTSAYDMFDATPISNRDMTSSYQIEQVHLAKNSLHLLNLWKKLTDSGTGVEFKDHRLRFRKLSKTLLGEDLIEWLLSNEISNTRGQAFVIGQALLDAEFIKNLPDVKTTAFSEENLYQPGENWMRNNSHGKLSVDPSVDLSASPGQSSQSRTLFDQASPIDGGNEPNWVREITVEEEYDDSCGSDDITQPWATVFPSLKPFMNESALFSEDGSCSPMSSVSLSSYIEIDNQRNVIKYNRRSCALNRNHSAHLVERSGTISDINSMLCDVTDGVYDDSNVNESMARNRDQMNLQEPRFIDESVTEINADYIRGYLSWHGAYSSNLNINNSVGWREGDVYDRSISTTTKQTFCKLQNMYFNHSMRFLKQLFKSKLLEATWSDIIVQLATRIREAVIPNCEDNMDIGHYVHLKKLLDGPPQDSRLLNGVVFSKNVVNNRMRTRIDNPVIMLIATPLEYQRVNYKFASLDPVFRQEPEFFKNLTSRILRRQPDIVISQCSVAHVARQLLRDAGITLIINVKKSVMERLARSTGADIARSIDQLQHIRLGSCGKFRVIKHGDGKRNLLCSDGPITCHAQKESTNSYKTMIYLDGCPPAHGCTVLLRSNPDYDQPDADALARQSLSEIKSVLLSLVRILYHCKLELSYLMDQQDLATSGITSSSRVRTKTESTASVHSNPNIANHVSESSALRSRSGTVGSQASDSNTLILETNDAGDDDTDALTNHNPSFVDAESTRGSQVVFPQPSQDDLHSAFSTTLLSYSPFIPIRLPFLLTDRGRSSPLFIYLPRLLYWSEKFPESTICEEDCQLNEFSSRNNRLDGSDVTRGSNSDQYFSSMEGMWETSTPNYFNKESNNSFDNKETSVKHSSKLEASHSDPINKVSDADGEPCDVELSHGDDETTKSDPGSCERSVESVRWVPEKHPFLTASLSKPSSWKDMQELLADFRANGSSLRLARDRPPLTLNSPVKCICAGEKKPVKKKRKFELCDCLTLSNHQHIFVLFSSYSLQSPNSPYPCVLPWAVDIDFYKGNDITLGGFLDRYCFRPSYQCPNPSCGRTMLEHIRSFVHGRTCMNIVLKELSKPVVSSHILTWRWNSQSKTSTDLQALSHDVRSMSFAKFLELRLGTFPSSMKEEEQVPDQIPPFTSFQYFLYNDIVAAFKCFEVNVLDIALPPLVVEFQDRTSWMKVTDNSTDGSERSRYQTLLKAINSLSKVGYDRMDTIREMISTTRSSNLFDLLTVPEQAEWADDISNLKAKREAHFDQLMALYHEERCHLRDSVDGIHLKLQSLRINSENVEEVVASSTPSKDSLALEVEAGSTCSASPAHSGLGDGVEDTPCLVVMDEESEAELLKKLLELTCLISQLIYTWNERVGDVVEQDRLSRKGNRISNLDLYSEQPVALDTSLSSRDGKVPNSPMVSSSQETTDEQGSCRLSEVDGNSYVKPMIIGQEESSEVIDNAFKDESSNSMKSQGSDESQPIPIPSRSVEKAINSIAASKRQSRTSSTMNVKSLVSQFLSNPTQTQVRNPFPSDEHYLLSNCASSGVVVRDDEPSSIIAYTLNSSEYHLYIESTNSIDTSNDGSFPLLKTSPSLIDSSDVSMEAKIVTDDAVPKVTFKVPPSRLVSLSAPKPASSTGSSPIPSPPRSPSLHSPHIEVQFKDSTTKFYCKVYFASQFKALRQQILQGREEDYVRSLGRCVRWAARGGKSGSAFHKTVDDRLVLKQMSRFEMQSFLEVANDYLDYVTIAVQKKRATALSKILGVYRVSYRNTNPGRTFKQDILVMENLFYKRNIRQVFDLKGSVRNRHVKTFTDDSTAHSSVYKSDLEMEKNLKDVVLLDENLLTIMRDRPLYVYEHAKKLIKRALYDDAKFLANHLIIDYSLLVGIDSDKQEIVVGIIDYLRTFTWDKKLEMVVKSYGMIARQGTRSMPTVVSPEIYRSRFCDAMERYFQVVPDRWFGLQAHQQLSKEQN